MTDFMDQCVANSQVLPSLDKSLDICPHYTVVDFVHLFYQLTFSKTAFPEIVPTITIGHDLPSHDARAQPLRPEGRPTV